MLSKVHHVLTWRKYDFLYRSFFDDMIWLHPYFPHFVFSSLCIVHAWRKRFSLYQFLWSHDQAMFIFFTFRVFIFVYCRDVEIILIGHRKLFLFIRIFMFSVNCLSLELSIISVAVSLAWESTSRYLVENWIGEFRIKLFW